MRPSYKSRLDTIFKKAYELTVLCNTEVCVIHYGPDGELQTWPEDRDKVRDMALRYSQLDLATRRKKSFDLYGFLDKVKKKTTKMTVNPPHYSSDQIIHSLELTLVKLQERLRFVESHNHGDALSHHNLTQSLNPSSSSPFSLIIYNHGDDSFSQIPLSKSLHLNLTHALPNHYKLWNQDLCGYDQNIIKANNFQIPCVSNAPAVGLMQRDIINNTNNFQQHEAYDHNISMIDTTNNNRVAAVPDSVLMQSEEIYGCDQNIINTNNFQQNDQNICCSMTDTTNNSSVIDPCLLDDFWSEFEDSSFFQDFEQMSTSNDVSNLLQTPTLPSLHTNNENQITLC